MSQVLQPPSLTLLEHTAEPAWALDADAHLIYANAAARAFLEVDSAEDGPAWPPAWPEASRLAFERALRTARGEGSAAFRVFIPGQDAAGRFWQIALTREAVEDRPAQVLVLAREVTQKVERLAFLESIVQALPMPLLVKTVKDGRFALINRSAEAYLDTPAEELIGQVDTRPRPPQELAAEAQCASGGGMITTEEMISASNWPEPRQLSVRRLATHDDEGPRHLIAIGEDVTETRAHAEALRLALASAERANTAKDLFLANMSHELRTPLHAIVAAGDLLARRPLDDAGRELVDMMTTAGGVLQQLLSDLLGLTRASVHEAGAGAAPFDLRQVVETAAWIARIGCERGGVAFRLETEDAVLDAPVVGDAAALSRTLSCLLSNAVKFTAAGEVALSVERRDGGRWRFAVRDTGVGFDVADKERLFLDFEQGDVTLARRYGGAGLGLPLAQRLVARMGGRIDCASRLGAGSHFWFDAPLAPEPSQAEPAPEAAPSATRAPRSPKDEAARPRVLLVDDHPANRRLVELMLGDMAEIATAADGREAVERFRGWPPDVVLMDMQMPVMDGLCATRELRRIEAGEGRARTPVIMVSANVLPEHVAAALKAGADAHLAKPLTAPTLFATLQAYV